MDKKTSIIIVPKDRHLDMEMMVRKFKFRKDVYDTWIFTQKHKHDKIGYPVLKRRGIRIYYGFMEDGIWTVSRIECKNIDYIQDLIRANIVSVEENENAEQ